MIRLTSSTLRRLGAALSLLGASAAYGSETKLVDIQANGALSQAGLDLDAAISSDGQFVAFTSTATNLAAATSGGIARVYLRTMGSNAMVLVSKRENGSTPATGDSSAPSISSNGQYVLFQSYADLVPGVALFSPAVYVYDSANGLVECVSRDLGGSPLAATLPGGGGNRISYDGRYVLFDSTSNLVPGDSGFTVDVYVRDRVLQQTILVSHTASGTSGDSASVSGAISADGTHVLFRTASTDLAGTTGPGMYVKDLVNGTCVRVDVDAGSTPIAGGANALDMTLSANAQVVAFTSLAANPQWNDPDAGADVYVVDVATHAVEVVSHAPNGAPSNGDCLDADLTHDGRYVLFRSNATNVVPWDLNGGTNGSDAVLFDRLTQRPALMNVSTTGAQGASGLAYYPSISDDGRYVAFVATQTLLAIGDNVGTTDIFVRDRIGFGMMGYGKGGSLGVPLLGGSGSTAPGGSGNVSLSSAQPNAPAMLMLAIDRTYVTTTSGPFVGTTIATANPLIILTFNIGPAGTMQLPYTLPIDVLFPPEIYLQAAVSDPTAFGGAAVSNAIMMGF